MSHSDPKTRELLPFKEIGTAPQESGLYAWYYRPPLREYAVEALLEELRNDTNAKSRVDVAARFLEEKLLEPFSQTPYDVTIKGRLKPEYVGELQHEVRLSESAAKRVAAKPALVRKLGFYINQAIPRFSVPIYIGQAKVLRRRLLAHKTLIECYREQVDSMGVFVDDVDDYDRSFAQEVVRRKLDPQCLGVVTLVIKQDAEDADGEDLVTVMENILNRLVCPMCGRN